MEGDTRGKCTDLEEVVEHGVEGTRAECEKRAVEVVELLTMRV
jgi:hypothetical protein